MGNQGTQVSTLSGPDLIRRIQEYPLRIDQRSFSPSDKKNLTRAAAHAVYDVTYVFDETAARDSRTIEEALPKFRRWKAEHAEALMKDAKKLFVGAGVIGVATLAAGVIFGQEAAYCGGVATAIIAAAGLTELVDVKLSDGVPRLRGGSFEDTLDLWQKLLSTHDPREAATLIKAARAK